MLQRTPPEEAVLKVKRELGCAAVTRGTSVGVYRRCG